MEKKLDGNCTRVLRNILNKSWKQHPTKQQRYDYQLPISKTIQIRQIRHAGHCWRNKGELISDVLMWTLSHRQAGAGRPARTYLQTRDVVKRICRMQWTIERNGEGVSGKFILAA